MERSEVAMEQAGGAPNEPDKLEGRYANYFEVGHNAFEFLIDFGQLYSETGTAQLHTRIITSPTYAKAFLETLRESVERYERTFGAIGKEKQKP